MGQTMEPSHNNHANENAHTEKHKELEKERENGKFKKISLIELMGLLGNIFTVLTFCSIDYISAKYQGKGALYRISQLVMAVMWAVVFFEIFYVLYCHSAKVRIICGKIGFAVYRNGKNMIECIQQSKFVKRYPKLVYLVPCFIMVFIGTVLTVYFYGPETKYYAAVSEVYGIPRGIGELQDEQRDGRAFYWKIKEYPFRKCVVLTYVEPYGQIELLRDYSTAYNMDFFRPYAKIEYKYTKNEDKFRTYGQLDYFHAAEDNDFRVPEEISYYGSNGKLLMELDKNGEDKFKVSVYSVEDTPQLFQSTLFRETEPDSDEEPDSQMGGNDLTLRQIEVTYNSAGLPEMRRLSAGINNQYGVNGERYDYDQDNRLTTLCYLNADGIAVCNKLGIMLVTFQYDEDGNLHSIRYFSDEDGTERTEGFHGVFCEKMEYDANGNLEERKQLDRSENWCYDTNGIYMYRYTYEDGSLTKENYYGFDGNEIRDNVFHSSAITFGQCRVGSNREISVALDSVNITTSTLEGVPVLEEDSAMGIANIVAEENPEKTESWFTERNKPAAITVDSIAVFKNAAAANKNPERETADFTLAEDSEPDEPFWQQEDADTDNENKKTVLVKNSSDNQENVSAAQTDLKNEMDFSRNYASVRYIVNERNCIIEEAYYDGEGEPVCNEKGYAYRCFKYDGKLQAVEEDFYGTGKKACLVNGGYAVVKNTYATDQWGVVESKEYLDLEGKKTVNKTLGYACIRYERVNQGRNTEVARKYYDAHGNLIRLRGKDYAVVKQTYNKSGYLIREAYYDEKDKPVFRTDYGVSEILYEYADDGNMVCEWYKDVGGKGVNRTDTGYAVVYQMFEAGQVVMRRYEGYHNQTLVAVADATTGAAIVEYAYDNGRKRQEQYFDTAKEPVLRKDTGFCIREYEYDEKGKNSLQRFYGTDGQLVLRKDMGCAVIKYKYNDFGQCTESRYYGVDGQPIISTEYWCAGFQYVYDDNGNNTDIYYLGLQEGQPEDWMVRRDLGIAHIKREYDSSGNLTKESYFDAEGKSTTYQKYGFASYEDTFVDGKVTESKYLDTEGNPVVHGDRGYAIVRYQYNDSGQCVSEKYYGVDGESMVISPKYHCAGFQYNYDNRGNKIKIQYLDIDGSVMVRRDLGYAQGCTDYDEFGNDIRASYFDEKGKPAIWKEGGCAVSEFDYDRGNCVERRYLDAEGNLMLRHDTGYAIVRYQYDDFGRCISELYYDTDEKPVISTKFYCAGFQYKYDEKGNKTDTWYIGTDGKYIIRCDLGYAHIQSDYDELGNEIKVSYLDTEGEAAICKSGGWSTCTYQFEKGNCKEKRYLDKEGNLVLTSDNGWAIVEYSYDDLGQCTAEYYRGADKNPVVSTEYHCAGLKFAYDDRGRRTDTWYIGTDDEVMVRRDLGYAHVHSDYDAYGNEIGVAYYDTGNDTDTEEPPALWKDGGYASCEFLYEDGNCTERRYFDKEGNPVLRKDTGYSVVKYEYDGYGQCITELYYDKDDKDDKEEKPMISTKYHCAGMKFRYNDRGYKICTQYIGLDGEMMVRRDLGYAQLYSDYDEFGNEVMTSYADEYRKGVVRKDGGYVSCKYKYDQRGRCIEKAYFGIKGVPVLHADDGYSVMKFEYNEFGQCIAEAYCNAEGQPMISKKYRCASREFAYDDRGNRTDTWCKDSEGNLMTRTDTGYAWIHSEYDDFDNERKVSYFDTEGKPAIYKVGQFAAYESVYENKKCVERRYLNGEDTLILRSDKGYAVIEYEYDKWGQMISERYYDTEGRLYGQMAGRNFAYDDRGIHTDTWYIGADGDCILHPVAGYAHVHSTYDDYGNQMKEEYFDKDEKLIMRKDCGYASCKFSYDGSNHCIEKSFYNTQEDLTLCTNGDYAIVQYEYDEYGQCTDVYYLKDKDSWTINSETQYAICSYEYDEMGNTIYIWYYDADGELTACEDTGIANECMEYDAYGHWVFSEYYLWDEEEGWVNVVRKDLGYASVYHTYEQALWMGTEYYGADGKLMVPEGIGYAVYEREYNSIGQVIRVKYYDADKELTPYINNEAAVIEYTYDAAGNVVERNYYDEDENYLYST